MDDALAVGRLRRQGEGLGQPGGRRRRQRRAGQGVGQAAAGAVLQGQVRQPLVLADLVDLHHVGVTQPGGRLGLAAEAGPLLGPGQGAGPDDLQGHQPPQGQLPRLVDHAHAAPAQFAQHLVARRAGR